MAHESRSGQKNVHIIKPPPHSPEAETSVIGAVLLDNAAFDSVSWLAPHSFYSSQNRLIWSTIARSLEQGRAVDMVTLCDMLGDDVEKAGGAAYIAECAQNTPSAITVRRYAELVRDKAILRDLAQRGTEIAEEALSGARDPLEIADSAAATFMAIQQQTEREQVPFGKAMAEAVERLDNPTSGLETGYADLDAIVRGLNPGDLIIVAGRPSMGKTALAMNIAEHVSASQTTLIFSLEMTRAKVAARSLRYHQAMLGRDDALDHLYGLKLHIDDSGVLKIPQIRWRSRKLQKKVGLGLIVVDYLQLIDSAAENRTQEVSAISRGLKAIAKDLNVPIIAVSQLSRGVESRPDKRPHLSDLRESGQIEQDADLIICLYREEAYDANTEWKGIAEVIVRKNRDGALGTAYLEFIPEFTRFKPLTKPLPNPPAPKPKVANFQDYKTRAAGDGPA